jgi:hypothetical protein
VNEARNLLQNYHLFNVPAAKHETPPRATARAKRRKQKARRLCERLSSLNGQIRYRRNVDHSKKGAVALKELDYAERYTDSWER